MNLGAMRFGVTSQNVGGSSGPEPSEFLYLKNNGVTVAAFPETPDGWYRWNKGEGREWFLVVKNGYDLRSILDKNFRDIPYSSNDEVLIDVEDYGETKPLKTNNIVTTKVTSFSEIIRNYNEWEQNISSWDTSNVANFSYFLQGCDMFNGDISHYDFSVAFNISFMLINCTSFNGQIGTGDFSSLTAQIRVESLARNCVNLNQDFSHWCVENVFSITTGVTRNILTNTPTANNPSFHPKWGEPCITCPDGSRHHEDYECPL